MSSWQIGGGYNWGGQEGENHVGYVGNSVDALRGYLGQLINGGTAGYENSGAMYDMLMGGRGFGQSRRYDQYNPYSKTYGYLAPRPLGAGGSKPPEQQVPGSPDPGNSGGGSPEDPVQSDPGDGGYTGGGGPGPGGYGDGTGTGPGGGPQGGGVPNGNKTAPGPGGQSALKETPRNDTGMPIGPSPVGALGPGQQDPNDWYDPDDPHGLDQYGGQEMGGPGGGWNVNDDAPVEGQGYLGDVENYGKPTALDDRLVSDYGWQAGGDLSDLEQEDKWNWQKYGQKNADEAANDEAINWQRGGELSDLEQQEKWGFKNYANATDLENEVGDSWRGVAGPGQYDPLRGDTLSGMVGSKGYSPTERSAMMGSSLLPIQQQLQAQQIAGDARQAATGNAAGRWGASNANALNAAGLASQAGRDIEMGSAATARQDRAQGLEGLGGLQSQIDARKVQGASGLQDLSGQQRQAGAVSLGGLSNLAGKQRANQQFGIGAAANASQQQRQNQALANEGISGLGQRQRQNQMAGLNALSGQNAAQKQDKLAGMGLKKDLMDSVDARGQAEANRAAQLASLVAGGGSTADSSGGSAAVSV